MIKAKHAGLSKKDTVLHMFHLFAKVLEVVPDAFARQVPKIDIKLLKPSDILANQDHFKRLKSLFVIECLRVATKRIQQLKKYRKYVVKHISHKYSDVLQHASVTVMFIAVKIQ